MTEPQDTSPKAPADNLEARLATLEQEFAAPKSASPTSVEFAGGTIIHIPPFGSFHVAADTIPVASCIGLTALFVVGVLALFIRSHHARHEPN